jgi:hypothetical protein
MNHARTFTWSGYKPLPTRLNECDDLSMVTPQETAAIQRHLYEQRPVQGVRYQSSLIAILNDARGAADRDGRGHVRRGSRSQSWLAATGYMVLLDQVGTSFRVAGATTDRFPHSIGRAISHFSPLRNEAAIHALYALRCALAHDYSLFNRRTRPSHELDHAFNFTADTVSPLVELPAVAWNRVYRDPPEEQTTIVNLRKLGDLGESVVATLRNLHRRGRLELRLPLDEFEWRYGMRFYV